MHFTIERRGPKRQGKGSGFGYILHFVRKTFVGMTKMSGGSGSLWLFCVWDCLIGVNRKRKEKTMQKKRYRRKKSPLPYILLALACVIFSVLLLSRPGEEHYTVESAAETQLPTVTPAPAPATPQPTSPPAPGTLLESGSDINENYYKKLHFTGTASDLTASSFVLGRERPATNGATGQDHPGELTVHFGPDTVVKTALLYYPEDRYEIYMGSAADLKLTAGYTFDVVLEDPAAAQLWAREITVSTFVFG